MTITADRHLFTVEELANLLGMERQPLTKLLRSSHIKPGRSRGRNALYKLETVLKLRGARGQ